MFLRPAQKAFSLIELMIVISIIGVISAVSLGSLTLIQKNNRDAQRQSDLRLIQGALQQFYADKNYYPNALTLTAGAAINNCTSVAGCVTATKTYLGKSPVDPTGTLAYCYESQFSATVTTSCSVAGNEGKCHFYKLNAKQENPSGTTTYTCNSNATYNFQVTPL